MNNIMSDVPAVAVIMFLVWVAVNLGIPKKFAPLLAWVTGLLIAYFSYENGQILDVIYYGTFIAASAIGFHSGGKNTYQQFMNLDTKNINNIPNNNNTKNNNTNNNNNNIDDNTNTNEDKNIIGK